MVMTVPPFTFEHLDGLTGLAGLADRTGIDIRPTLLRVLTDLYIQKPSHSADEERHYSELALRLIEVVDASTRAAIAARLASYPKAPARILKALASFAPEGISMTHPFAHAPIPSSDLLLQDDLDIFEPAIQPAARELPPGNAQPVATKPQAASFVEQRETFFAADAGERKLILLNLEYVAQGDGAPLLQGTGVLRYLEQAALAGRIQEFTTLLQQSIGVSRATAARIVSDPLGEPFVVAAKAIAMPANVVQRVVLFLNQAIGHSVERVYELADLFAQLPLPSALHLVAVWRAADSFEAKASLYRPLHWHEAEAARRDPPVRQTHRIPDRKSAMAFGRRDLSKR